jgi:hypothetical protein
VQRNNDRTMKLQPDRSDVQSISGYGPGWVGVDGEKITKSVILSSRGERIDWPFPSKTWVRATSRAWSRWTPKS